MYILKNKKMYGSSKTNPIAIIANVANNHMKDFQTYLTEKKINILVVEEARCRQVY